ncbi:MAG: DUF4112 domain-containing protein [Gemmatimonadota bacterium]
MTRLTAPPSEAELARFRGLARVWDEAIRLPIIGRVGLDALVGLIPGLGDIAGGLLAGYGLMIAARLKAPPIVLLRMLVNIAIDTVGGVIPIAGDIFDSQFRANTRNLALLEAWLADPHGVRRRSVLVLIGVAAAFCALLTLTVWLAVRAIAWIFSI